MRKLCYQRIFESNRRPTESRQIQMQIFCSVKCNESLRKFKIEKEIKIKTSKSNSQNSHIVRGALESKRNVDVYAQYRLHILAPFFVHSNEMEMWWREIKSEITFLTNNFDVAINEIFCNRIGCANASTPHSILESIHLVNKCWHSQLTMRCLHIALVAKLHNVIRTLLMLWWWDERKHINFSSVWTREYAKCTLSVHSYSRWRLEMYISFT